MIEEQCIQYIGLAKDIAGLLASIVIAAVAIYGVSQWRREMRGRARFDVAKKMAYEAFSFRDHYNRARGLFTHYSESADREKLPEEEKEETHWRDEHYARRRRIQPLQEALRNLYQSSWEAGIIFDECLTGLIQPFEDKFMELLVAIDTYFSRYIERTSKGQTVSIEDHPLIQKDFKVIYGTADDDFSKEVDTITNNFVSRLRDLAV
jgi:hypothetical protein